MSSEGKVLVVDDEPNIAEVVRLYLEHSDYEAILLPRGQDVLRTIQSEKPHLVLLDIMLPDTSGYELCESIRRMEPPLDQTPIIFLTAKGESIDKLRGFNLGVDDYIVKPFDPNELIARVKAVLRRSLQARPDMPGISQLPPGKCLEVGNLIVDMEQYRVTVGDKRVELTPKEIELLYFLCSHPGRVFTREDLLGYVWNFDFTGGTRTVDAHVKNLRKKLGQHDAWNIQTLWGIGYSFEVVQHV
ncbi:response regulator transcription factor [Paenibacillus sp. GCM10027628]|uniref:response regulator transcription factor n=1 Tax=Paenibacillus sp. GCM10027628 TaxID=3273413 RepID=UPI00362F7348